jgi:hypothetical protein
MDFLPREFPGTGAPDAGGGRLTRKLRLSLPQFQPLPSDRDSFRYAVVLLISDALNRAAAPTDASRQQSGILSLMSRSRWFWLPAVYALALLVVLMITLTQQGGVGQMTYRSF